MAGVDDVGRVVGFSYEQASCDLPAPVGRIARSIDDGEVHRIRDDRVRLWNQVETAFNARMLAQQSCQLARQP